MKVLLVFPMADRQTGPAIKYAFEQLGHYVKAIDARLQTNKIYESYREIKADLVFCTKTPEITDQIKLIKKEFNSIICMWNPDSRANIKIWERLFPLIRITDYHFVVEYSQIPEWRKLNPNTFWLLQGLQNEVYNKPKKITDDDRKEYVSDISFAGRRHSYRRPYLDRIEEMNLDFRKWGCAGRGKIYNEEHNKMASLAKINFACSANSELNGSISVRDYKIMGAGGFLLELQRRGLGEIFPFDLPGLIGTYLSPDDLMQRIRFWLDHEEERKAMAERGYEWVHKNATYTHRIKKALEIMGL